jgi:5-oxoprolinase (ATP-hydrolysing) subunit A
MNNYSIDINCDMGEGMPQDAELMPYISSANIACGYHAGNDAIMQQTIDGCMEQQVAIGAHPSYPDKENFGRTNMMFTEEDVYAMVCKQISQLATLADKKKARLRHVKPHGALYNTAATDTATANAVCRAVASISPALLVYGLPDSALSEAASHHGLTYCNEAFADRTYTDTGLLTPRHQPQAILTATAAVLQQVLQLVQQQSITTVTGNCILIRAQTICLHGDGPQAAAFAKAIWENLQLHHITIKAPHA